MAGVTRCGCTRSLAVICGAFASIAVTAMLAEVRCLDRGGRVSDSAWSCALPAGAIQSLWEFVSAGNVALIVILVGVPVYFAVSAVARRWLFAYAT